jgi:hypothetical protein
MQNTINPEQFFSSKTINGKRYSIQPMPVWTAWNGWTLILKTIAPVFGEVLDSRNVDESMMFEKANTFREVLTILATNLHTAEMLTLIQQMLQGSSCESAPLDVETAFLGKGPEMMELIMYAFEVNFKGFFTQSDIFHKLTEGMGKIMGGTDQ